MGIIYKTTVMPRSTQRTCSEHKHIATLYGLLLLLCMPFLTANKYTALTSSSVQPTDGMSMPLIAMQVLCMYATDSWNIAT